MSAAVQTKKIDDDGANEFSSFHFLRGKYLRVAFISALVLIPCFWHRHIEAGDLPSHVYNAWLTHLIKMGTTPGLWLATRWNNVLYDFALSGIGILLGWNAAEKIATAGSVLLFFWGVFAFICAITRRPAWFMLPVIGMISYGWMFEMGFMNCYISIGIAFWGLAILLNFQGAQRWFALCTIPLIWLAHPLGLILLLGFGAYAMLAEHLSHRGQLYLLMTALALIGATHVLLVFLHAHFLIMWRRTPYYLLDGFDQFLLYQPHYLLLAHLLRIAFVASLIVAIAKCFRAPRWWVPYYLPFQLWLLAFAAVQLLPTDIDGNLFHRIGFLSIGFLTERATSVVIVMFCCLIGAVSPEGWFRIGSAFIAAIFFLFLYVDSGVVAQMEDLLRAQILQLPTGQRVIGPILSFRCSSRVSTAHIIDRACVGHCFSYGNYEVASGQFRVRAARGNPFVLTDWSSDVAVLYGGYLVQERDLPLIQIYQSNTDLRTLGIRKLAAGDRTTSLVGKSKCNFVQNFGWGALFFDLGLSALVAGTICGIIRRFSLGATRTSSRAIFSELK